jgi:transcriptional regulator with XRE-family HTH domain
MTTAIIKTIGKRIKRIRQERGWSQAQLATKLNVHQKQISGYERNLHIPSTEVLIKIAKTFNLSLDFLVFEDRNESVGVNIGDIELLQKLEEIDKLSEQDKNTVKAVLDTFITKSKFQQLAILTG